MNPDARTEAGPATVISELSPGQIDPALSLLVAQLKEHGLEPEAHRLRTVIERVVADQRRGFFLVATHPDGRIVGVAFGSAFLGLEHGGESGWLEELYVLPEWRRKGIGTNLLLKFIRIAQARGWRAVDLEVQTDHRPVAALYERHGFLAQPRERFCLKLD